MSGDKIAEAEIVLREVDTENMQRADALAIWTGFESKVAELKASADALLSADPTNPTNCKLARVARLELKATRVEIEAKRKELGEYHLRKTQAINADAKKLKELIEPYEDKLLAIEQHAERVEAERQRVLCAERVAALTAVGGTCNSNLGAMDDVEWSSLIEGATLVFQKRQEEARLAEEARIAKEKAEAEERERIRQENERLKIEAEAREKQHAAERAKAEAEAKAAAEVARKEREAIEAKAKAEREASEAKAKQEREAREKLEAEVRAKEEAEKAKAKAEADRVAKEEEAKRIAAEEAELAPDRKKLATFAATVRAIQVPTITSKKGQEIIAAKIEELALWVESASTRLKATK